MSLRGLVLATHAGPTVAVTAFATALAGAAGLGARTALVAAAVLVGQASVGWANDALDAPLDLAAARRDKPVVLGLVTSTLLWRAAVTAVIVDVPLSLALGWRAGAAHVIAVASAWTYNVSAKFTRLSPLPYALSFGLLPVAVAGALPHHPRPQLALVGAGVALGLAAHFANTVADVEADAGTGVRGLPQRLGPAVSIGLAAAGVALAAALLVATVRRPLTVVAAVVAVVVAGSVPVAVRRSRARQTAFALVVLAVGVLVLAFVVDGGSQLVAS